MFRPESDESSYEAAMRAADALFAAPSRRRTEDGTDSAAQRDDADVASAERGRRILRVLDEAPPPEFAALEAEYAPKRRGRKPGSKNKPKLPSVESDTGAKYEAPPRRAASLPPAPSHVASPVLASPVSAAHESAAHVSGSHDMPARSVVPAARQLVALPATGGAPRGERFAWVRDRLKPGEDWKRRRLPKICW